MKNRNVLVVLVFKNDKYEAKHAEIIKHEKTSIMFEGKIYDMLNQKQTYSLKHFDYFLFAENTTKVLTFKELFLTNKVVNK